MNNDKQTLTMSDLKLSCQCGKVTGKIKQVTPDSGNHLVCYCHDCQSFANHLNPDSDTLNTFGGTEIFQIPPVQLEITKGKEHIACLKLSKKGLHRWYTSCCNTPLGNTVGPGLPFVGVIHSFFAKDQDTNSVIGPILGSVNLHGATGKVPDDVKGPKSSVSLLLRVIRKLIGWKLLGKGKPNPLYGESGKAIAKPTVVQDK